MLRKISARISVSFFVALSTSFASPLGGNKSVELQINGIYGLEMVPFDLLTQALVQKTQSETIPSASKMPLTHKTTLKIEQLQSSENSQSLFSLLLNYVRSQSFTNESDYYKLALEIAQLRDVYRSSVTPTDLKIFRQNLFLLQLVQEEILYVGYSHFNPTKDGNPSEKNWIWVAPKDPTELPGEEIELRGIPIQNGDVILPKASGMGSSAFIALTGDAPHVFSHSTIATIRTIDGQRKLLTPEADIADGVKLRDFSEYKKGKKTRLFVYRLKNQGLWERAQIQGATDRFLDRMFAITPDPINHPAFPYDFNLDPDTEGAYYCAAIPCRIYRDTEMADIKNPYPVRLWAEPTEIRRKVYDFLSLPKKPSPSPGDLEANSNYRLIGTEIQLHRLETERVELAVIDSMFDVLENHTDVVEKIIQKTETLGSEPIQLEFLKPLVTSGILPPSALEKIPTGIKPRQMVFFGYLNEVFTPKIRALVLEQLVANKAKDKILGPQELRAIAYSIQEEKLTALLKGMEDFIEKIRATKDNQSFSEPCLKALKSPL